MEPRVFRFQLSPYDTELLQPQLSRALEKRTELASRKACPGLWRVTDRLRAVPSGRRRRSKTRTRILSGMCLVLGLLLFLPGLMDPRTLFVPLLTGAAAIGAGIGGLWRTAGPRTKVRAKESRFDKAARTLLDLARSISPDTSAGAEFSDAGLTLPEEGGGELVPYDAFACVIEMPDGFLLVFDTRAAVLQKRDLTAGSLDELREFLREKVPQYDAVS